MHIEKEQQYLLLYDTFYNCTIIFAIHEDLSYQKLLIFLLKFLE